MRIARISVAALAVLAILALLGLSAQGGELGSPVIERLGEVMPTPAPSPKVEERIRLIESLTMQNTPEGSSIITFQAADYVESEIGAHRTLAIEQYSLIEPKPEARELRDEIVRKVRELERDLLEYVEITGPPRALEGIQDNLGGQQPVR